MRKLLSPLVLMVLLVGCGGSASPGSGGGGGQVTNGPTNGTDATDAPGSGPAATDEPSAATTTTLPPACAEGLGKYLVAIEPLVSKFDPAKDTLGDLYKADDKAGDKAMELLTANDSRAPYSCSEVGLEWAYFDASTPWDAVLAVATASAPGTVPYLNALRDQAATDEATLADYGIDGCDAAVSSIRKDVKARSKKASGVDEMSVPDGLDLVGRYNAYMHEVQDEVCPRDQLGNDEFEFMGSAR